MDTAEANYSSSEIIPKLIEYMFDTTKCSNAQGGDKLQWRISIAFRRFAALSFIVRPDAVAKNLPAWKVAEAIGITPARLSQICSELSAEMGGLAHHSMRSASHRKACSEAKIGVPSSVKGKRPRSSSISTVPDNRYRASEQAGVIAAMDAFKAGKPWNKRQTRILFVVGYIDEGGTLTDSGIKAMDARP